MNAIEQSRRLQGRVLITVAGHVVQRQGSCCLSRPGCVGFQQTLVLCGQNPVVKVMLTRAVIDVTVAVAESSRPLRKLVKGISRRHGEQLFNKEHAVELREIETQPFRSGSFERIRKVGTAKECLGKTGDSFIHWQCLHQRTDQIEALTRSVNNMNMETRSHKLGLRREQGRLKQTGQNREGTCNQRNSEVQSRKTVKFTFSRLN